MKNISRSLLLLIISLFVGFCVGQTTRVSADKTSANEFLNAKKQIDFLGDGTKNPDTELKGEDDYRVYLDVVGTSVGKPTDIVFVLDHSNSMVRYNFASGLTRYDVLNNILKGVSNSQLGLINSIFEAQPENRISFKAFEYQRNNLSDWLTKSDLDTNKNGKIERSELATILLDDYSGYNYRLGSTNIEDGLWLAHEQLANDDADKRQQMVILLSDGLPTVVNIKSEKSIIAADPTNRAEYDGFEKSTARIVGDDVLVNIAGDGRNSTELIQYGTKKAAEKFKDFYPNVMLATIFMDENSDSATTGKQFLADVASAKSLSYAASNASDLLGVFEKLIGIMQNVTIADELSEYVDYGGEAADLKVEKKSKDGTIRSLSSSEYVLTEPTTKEPKKFSVMIKGGLEIDATYTVSFNVKVNQQAKEAIDATKNGADRYGKLGQVGDKNTDYPGNTTSSGKIGLRSNEQATVSWERENETGETESYEYIYNHPVIQVAVDQSVIEPVVPIVKGQKQIDYLGDGQPNPDTKLAGKKDYRLYLDAVDQTDYKESGMDLVVVIDKSSSMAGKLEAEISRISAINRLLGGEINGTGKRSGSNFFANFLGLHADNQISVVEFGAKSTVLLNWSKDSKQLANKLNDSCFTNDDTNIESGLWQAQELLPKGNQKNEKMVLLLSDGEANMYFTATGSTRLDTLEGSGTVVRASETITSDQIVRGTLGAADAFRNTNKDVFLYGSQVAKNTAPPYVKIIEKIAGYSKRASVSPTSELLTSNVNGIAGTAVDRVVITDAISEEVTYNELNAELKVTETRKGSNTAGVIDSSRYTIKYDATKRELAVAFQEVMPREVKYTVSFNINLAASAQDNFLANKVNGNDGYAGVIGDRDSDYGANNTSSGKAGFHANKEAWVNWGPETDRHKQKYYHPVVQVQLEGAVTVVKESDGNPLAGAVFKLAEATVDRAGNWQEKVDGKTWEGTTAIDAKTGKAIYLFDHLPEGTYLLTEIKTVAGHSLLAKAIQITLPYEDDGNGMATTEDKGIEIDGKTYYYQLTYTVNNNKLFKLPDSGGNRLLLLLIAGVTLLSVCGIFVIISKKKRHSRRRRKKRQMIKR